LAQEIAKKINEGDADGSIRTDFDTMKLAHSAEFLIIFYIRQNIHRSFFTQ
jgi:hypothetical protein